jgi:homocysteine S-methyltransferase
MAHPDAPPLLRPFLADKDVVVLDGGLATELERRGLPLDDPLWSARAVLDAPELLRQVHDDYLAAGADVIASVSYQATHAGLAGRGLPSEAASQALRRTVEIAREARDAFWPLHGGRRGRARPLVAASIGPYGAHLADGSEYRGDDDLTVADLVAFHRPRFAALVRSGADLLAFETIPSIREAIALTTLLDEVTGVEAWLCFSCRDDRRVSAGDEIGTAVAAVDGCRGLIAVGVNCVPAENAARLLQAAGEASSKPLVVYPNGAGRWDASARRWRRARSQAAIAERWPLWQDAGALLVGGCCLTTPDDIRALRASVVAARRRLG